MRQQGCNKHWKEYYIALASQDLIEFQSIPRYAHDA